MSKLAFVHIPKAAGGSVLQWFLRNNLDLVYIKHKPLYCVPEYQYDQSFTIIRNTYHRLHSLYNFNTVNLSRKLAKKRSIYSADKIIQIEQELQAIGKGIDSWIDFYLTEIKPWSLFEWCKDVNTVLHFENINKDFATIQNRLCCFDPLLKEKHANTPKYYAMTDRFVNSVYSYFREEINYYKYQP